MGARNIGQYNAKVQAAQAEAKAAQEAGEELPDNELGDELPYIVIIIDELADLMMNVGKEVEFSISRIAQVGARCRHPFDRRHATSFYQRGHGLDQGQHHEPYRLQRGKRHRQPCYLGHAGCPENLIGLGDLLLSKPEYAKPMRIQGCYVSEDEINTVVEKLRSQGEPETSFRDLIHQSNHVGIMPIGCQRRHVRRR